MPTSTLNRPTAGLANTPLTALKGVGPKLADKFKKLSIGSLQDLLFHLPFRYEDRTHITPIGAANAYQFAVIEGKVLSTQINFGKRRSLMCRISDGSGIVSLRFFHFSAAQKNSLTNGTQIRCFGELRPGSTGLEIYHPEYSVLSQSNDRLPQTLTPVYPSTEGISQLRIRSITAQLIEKTLNTNESTLALQDYFPEIIYQRYKLMDLLQSLRIVHVPPKTESQQSLSEGKHPSIQRLAFEELVAHSLSFLEIRRQIQSVPAPKLKPTRKLQQAFFQHLEFDLTDAQKRVWQEISTDLKKGLPMLRMMQGDVGSGKTVVATLAALQTIGNGFQAALMAPTEILAEQHIETLSQWLTPLNIKVACLTGKTKIKIRRKLLEELANGEIDLLVGTHALFQEQVHFKDLALIIIDEQHRFGVEQRLALKQKGETAGRQCHQLVMTATPIPRTLAMSAYGDLDNSIIDQLPPGRTPVKTVVLANHRRDEIIARVRNACQQQKQAYWVCTLIEESEALQCQAAEDTFEQLKLALPELRLALIHGRLKANEKSQIMADFKSGQVDLLIATTVIEVGVNVPNASLMIIENPERLGLSQLHQLRGRVGRGATESFCVLLYHSPISKVAKQRLGIMRETTDGFKIAEHDLQIRGPGELLGTRQTGELQFVIADLLRDQELVAPAREAAETLFTQYANNVKPLMQRWLKQGEQYRQV